MCVAEQRGTLQAKLELIWNVGVDEDVAEQSFYQDKRCYAVSVGVE